MATQAPSISSIPVSSSSSNDADAISFHVFYASLFSDDKMITLTGERSPVEYYLECACHDDNWKLVLYYKAKYGRVAMKIKKPQSSDNFELVAPDGWSTTLARTGFFSDARTFEGDHGQRKYKWKAEGWFWWKTYECVDEQGNVAATWTNDLLSLVKHSHLRINAEYRPDAEFILATALANDEWHHDAHAGSEPCEVTTPEDSEDSRDL